MVKKGSNIFSLYSKGTPGPESATTVFSGGTLVTDELTNDAVVVVRNGLLLSWERRGDVEMPDDSVGMDMRGKWIVPGRQADLETGNLPNLGAWLPGNPANLLVLTTDPAQSAVAGDDLAGVVVDGEIRLFEES